MLPFPAPSLARPPPSRSTPHDCRRVAFQAAAGKNDDCAENDCTDVGEDDAEELDPFTADGGWALYLVLMLTSFWALAVVVEEYVGNPPTTRPPRHVTPLTPLTAPTPLTPLAPLAPPSPRYFVPALNVLCDKLNMPDDVAGATFMAAGASSPEMFAAFVSLFITHTSLGIGTIIGSEIFNHLCICAGRPARMHPAQHGSSPSPSPPPSPPLST